MHMLNQIRRPGTAPPRLFPCNDPIRRFFLDEQMREFEEALILRKPLVKKWLVFSDRRAPESAR